MFACDGPYMLKSGIYFGFIFMSFVESEGVSNSKIIRRKEETER